MASDARRLKALEDENAKLKKLLAEAMLERDLVRHWSEDWSAP
jgi:putative transposase